MDFFLLGTVGCHLCELAETIIKDCAGELKIKPVDIADETQWQERFATKIPVLFHADSQHFLAWPFSQNEVINFIERHHDQSVSH